MEGICTANSQKNCKKFAKLCVYFHRSIEKKKRLYSGLLLFRRNLTVFSKDKFAKMYNKIRQTFANFTTSKHIAKDLNKLPQIWPNVSEFRRKLHVFSQNLAKIQYKFSQIRQIRQI